MSAPDDMILKPADPRSFRDEPWPPAPPRRLVDHLQLHLFMPSRSLKVAALPRGRRSPIPGASARPIERKPPDLQDPHLPQPVDPIGPVASTREHPPNPPFVLREKDRP